jgi:hypothetical protein
MIGSKSVFNGFLVLYFIIGYSNDDAVQGPVFIHLDCNKFSGIYMGDSNNK